MRTMLCLVLLLGFAAPAPAGDANSGVFLGDGPGGFGGSARGFGNFNRAHTWAVGGPYQHAGAVGFGDDPAGSAFSSSYGFWRPNGQIVARRFNLNLGPAGQAFGGG